MTDLRPLLAAAVGAAYRIERELGGGGMSRVFLAEEVALGRRVVIKVLPPEMSASVNADRFRREIQLAAQLQHPAIVPLLTAGASEELLWFAMPFVEGESLRDRLARQGVLPLDDAVRIWRDLLEALEFAHQRRVVHRDIKPENIMMSGRHAVVMDFGVAKAVSAATSAQGLSGVTMAATQAGLAIGTPQYMAPEQAAGDPELDGRTDLYAAGLVMYEMLAGRGPFEARSMSEMLAAHLAKAPEPLGGLRPELPAALVEAVMSCLAKAPSDRPASATALLQELDRLAREISGARTPSAPMASSTVTTRSGEAAGRTTRFRIIAAVLAVAVGAGGWFGWTTWQKVSEAKAMMAVGLADSARLRVIFSPVASDVADSIIARTISATMGATLQRDRRLMVFNDDRVRNLLQNEGIDPSRATIDTISTVARGIGAHLYLLRSVARAGTGFVLSAEARASSGDSSIFQLQETAADASALTAASDRLARATHRGLLRSVGQMKRPLPDGTLFGTTPDAARLWVDAMGRFDIGDYLGAAAILRRAVRADSGFAVGWLSLHIALDNFGVNQTEAFTAVRNAYLYRERIRGNPTRLLVEASYLWRTGHYQLALDAAQRGLRLADPQLKTLFENVIGNIYDDMGQLDLSLARHQATHEATKSEAGVYTGNFVRALLDQGRVADVQRVIAEIDSTLGATHRSAIGSRIALAYGQRDAETILAISRQRLADAKTDGARLTALAGYQSGSLMRGQLDSAFAAAGERRRLYAKSGNPGALVIAAATEATARMEFSSDRAGAARVLDEALAAARWDTLPVLDRGYGSLITARSALGDVAGARRLLAEWQSDLPPELRSTRARALAQARGEILLAEGKGREALTAFRESASPSCPACNALDAARAHDLAGNADSTIANYERFLASVANRHSALNTRFTARAYKRLGELYEAKGDAPSAIKRYNDFVTLWRDADASLQPTVADVKARITKLQARRG